MRGIPARTWACGSYTGRVDFINQWQVLVYLNFFFPLFGKIVFKRWHQWGILKFLTFLENNSANLLKLNEHSPETSKNGHNRIKRSQSYVCSFRMWNEMQLCPITIESNKQDFQVKFFLTSKNLLKQTKSQIQFFFLNKMTVLAF